MDEADVSRYVVAGSRPWNRPAFERFAATRPPDECWAFVESRSELTVAALEAADPQYVFFLHWSWIVPDEITSRWECVCFHMTDVPYGRGGSPLQNLILRGHRSTVLTALQMVDEVDAGPVYAKRPLDLSGRAEDIYRRATDLSLEMAADLVARRPVPTPQDGAVTAFERRTPEQSALPEDLDLEQTYDFIRMLDAEGYPRAFVDHGALRFELSDAVRHADRVEATVRVRPREAAR
jgi:methionyl-tRNA formyltransferase